MTLPGRGVGSRSDGIIVSTCRDSACSIQHVGIALSHDPTLPNTGLHNRSMRNYWLYRARGT